MLNLLAAEKIKLFRSKKLWICPHYFILASHPASRK